MDKERENTNSLLTWVLSKCAACGFPGRKLVRSIRSKSQSSGDGLGRGTKAAGCRTKDILGSSF